MKTILEVLLLATLVFLNLGCGKQWEFTLHSTECGYSLYSAVGDTFGNRYSFEKIPGYQPRDINGIPVPGTNMGVAGSTGENFYALSYGWYGSEECNFEIPNPND